MSKEIITQEEAITIAIEKLRIIGLDYGSFFTMAQLRELAGMFGGEKTFPFFMMGLVERLRNEGKIVSSAELGGEGYRVLQQVENYHATQRWHDGVGRAYDRIVTVMTRMDRSAMTEAEKLRDANWLRQMEYERLMHRRSVEAIKVIQKSKPGLLKKDIEVEATPSE